MNADGDINLLNGLIAATMDSARHYRKVAASIGHPRIRALFEHLSVQRKLIAKQLQAQLTAITGNPQGESMTNAHHLHVFGNLRHVMDYGYCALIDEVERGEERINHPCCLGIGTRHPLVGVHVYFHPYVADQVAYPGSSHRGVAT